MKTEDEVDFMKEPRESAAREEAVSVICAFSPSVFYVPFKEMLQVVSKALVSFCSLCRAEHRQSWSRFVSAF